MAIELDSINKQLNLNITIEKAFDNFSKRAVSDDIKTFCEVLNSAKRTGGDIISIISLTSDTISEKIDLKRDLNRILAAKKYEHRIMSLMPIFIMIYIESTSKGFFNPVYNNLLGIIFMTICLLIYALSAFLASKIIKEDV
jgi:tight adherence protein B